MKFVQLMEYIMRHIVLEKSYTKCGGESLWSNILSVKYTIHLIDSINWLIQLFEYEQLSTLIK